MACIFEAKTTVLGLDTGLLTPLMAQDKNKPL